MWFLTPLPSVYSSKGVRNQSTFSVPDPFFSRKSRIISWRAIREFLEAHPEDQSARVAFAKWYDLVYNNRFASVDEVRRIFPSADLVGDLVVFNIRGNRYRLVARFVCEEGRVYIRQVLTHAEYDRGDWKE
jgi:mRNA interferase HigB